MFLAAALVISTGGTMATPRNEPVQPIESAVIDNPAKVELGKKLFFDPRLSKSGFISCNSCHNLSMGGTDNLVTSIGHNWEQGPINSPTVLNSGMNLKQFWNGRAADLKEQAAGPIANPGEMAHSHELAVAVVASIPAYRESFLEVYGKEQITIDELTDAIASFEDTLVTPDSRFDLWLKGDEKAITASEREGYQLFKDMGCVACHNGPALGGNMFQKMGLVAPYETQNPATGVHELTGNDADRMMFKVPTLRNVELTYPYFHDGAYWQLEEAVAVMGKLQLGRDLSDDETGKITAFLKTLTGKQPDFKLPILPPSTKQTPQPRPF
jgi:cytochrome c peroxidase